MRMPARMTLAALVATLVALVAAPTAIAKFQLRVLGLQPGQRFGINQVYNGFGCTGHNLSPALRISGLPVHTESLAITIHDPDAATQSGWWHWLIYDLRTSTKQLAEGAGTPGRARFPPAPGRDRTTSARSAMAACAPRPGIAHTATTSPCGR